MGLVLFFSARFCFCFLFFLPREEEEEGEEQNKKRRNNRGPNNVPRVEKRTDIVGNSTDRGFLTEIYRRNFPTKIDRREKATDGGLLSESRTEAYRRKPTDGSLPKSVYRWWSIEGTSDGMVPKEGYIG